MGKAIQPMRVLRDFVAQRGSQAAAAKAIGISPPLLSDILAGKRGFSDRVLKALGLRRTRTITDRYDEAR